MTRWFANILIWLALTAEIEGAIYAGLWETPLTTIGTALFRTVLHVVPWDVLVLITLALSLPGAERQRVPAVLRSIAICGASIALLWLWGVLRGGSAYQTMFQLHPFVMGLFVALLVANTYRSTAQIVGLGRLVVFACLYRSAMCILFYVLVAKDLPKSQELAALTDHCDSVLFVGGLFVLVINALEKRTTAAILWAVLGAAPIIAAIVLNNRRIAWLGVGVGFFLIFLLLPKGKLKRGIVYGLLATSPVLGAYVAAGWGNPVGIFKPVGSISTMFGDKQDTSSIMRDIENYNLLVTLKSNPLLGAGFGTQYVEEVRAFDIASIFVQYRYLPHNSLLGVIAFTGMLGFAGIWQMVVVATYLHAKVYRESQARVPRIAAMSCLVGILIIEVQMWGDIGFNHQMVCVMLAITVGLGARLPTLSGVWPGSRASKPLPARAAA